MPLSVEIPSEIEPGQNYQAWTWGPRVRIDADNQFIAVEFVAYASQEAAFSGGKPVATYTRLLSGKDFRNFVRQNTSLWTALVSAIDDSAVGVPALADAQPIEGSTLPAWASEPIEE